MAAQDVLTTLSADDRIVCAENLQEFHVNQKRMSFDDEFVQRISKKLNACSLESLRNQKPAQSKSVPNVN